MVELDLIKENANLKVEIERLRQENAKLSLAKKEFDEYEIINNQISHSKIDRINWKEIFGETLTKIVAEYYAEHKTPTETYESIKSKLSLMSITNPEILRRLKIGVCARFGEIRSEHKKIKETQTKKETPLWKTLA